MPITSWWCNQHKAVVSLNHFESCTYVHQDFAAAILADRELQADRTGVRVSNASACPRKSAILAAEDVAVDPLSYLTAMKGTAWHAVMEESAGRIDFHCEKCGADIWVTKGMRQGAIKCPGKTDDGEVVAGQHCGNPMTRIGAEIAVAGEIAGIPITGTIDRVLLRNGKLIGQDHKTGADARVPFIRGGKSFGKVISGNGAPAEYKVQLSLYAELYRQQFGRSWDAAELWWSFSKDHWVEPIEIMSVDECLAFKAHDSEYTVKQLLELSQQAADGGLTWRDLDLIGESMRFGKQKTMCDYCEVRDFCWTNSAEHASPF